MQQQREGGALTALALSTCCLHAPGLPALHRDCNYNFDQPSAFDEEAIMSALQSLKVGGWAALKVVAGWL